MKIIDLHMMSQLLRTCLIAIFAMSIPVILISVNSQISIFSISAENLWSFFLAISGIIIFHTMPVLVTCAIIWCYVRFWSEGTIVALFMSGRSTLAVVMPALLVAFSATLAGYAYSLFLKPMSEKAIHDTLYVLYRDLNMNFLEPGKFNKFDNGRTVIFVKKKITKNYFEDIYISNYEKTIDNTPGIRNFYYSKYAILIGEKGNQVLTLIDGSMVYDTIRMRKMDFSHAIWQPNSANANSLRKRIFLDELGTAAFLDAKARAFEHVDTTRLWLREAVKRFLIPLLPLTHALFALGLLNFFSMVLGRGTRSGFVTAFLCGVMSVIHAPLIFMIESISITGMPLAILVTSQVLLQLVAAAALFAGAQNLWLQSAFLWFLTRLFRLVPARVHPPTQSLQN